MRFSFGFFGLLFVWMAATGCGGGGGSGSSDEALEAAPGRLAEAICPRAYECCVMDRLQYNGLAGTDVASCKLATAGAFRSAVEVIRESQRRGLAAFNQSQLESCLATIQGSSCGELAVSIDLAGVPGCNGVVVPRVAIGGACVHNHDCIGGYCDRTADPNSDGTCTAYPVPVRPCSSTDASQCHDDEICYSGLCSFGSGQEGDDCRFDEECFSRNCDLVTGCSPVIERCFYEDTCLFSDSPEHCPNW
jgi:hypothetical protein